MRSAAEAWAILSTSLSLGQHLHQTNGLAGGVNKFIKDLAKSQQVRETVSGWLESTLFNEFCQDVPPIGGAGTWFAGTFQRYTLAPKSV